MKRKPPEEIEEDYPRILEDLKFHIAKQKIAEANDIKVEFQDIEALATEVAKAQFCTVRDDQSAGRCVTELYKEPAGKRGNYPKSLRESYRRQNYRLVERKCDSD